ncbi:MAG: D-alanyl-D-alanine carboxypeptidase family protein [Eubacteriales bacterium]
MMIKKILPIILILVILLSNVNIAFAAPVAERPWDEWVSGTTLRDRAVDSCEAAVLVEANSGRILFDMRSNSVREPASITKIMTALLAIENSNLTDIITIDNTMAELIMGLDGASLCGFQKNESVYMEDLLYGLMLLSGADAAIAIAVHVGGTYDNFVQMMNDKAEELGMTKTHFKNPHGLHQSGHVTCAEDMAKLARYANKLPSFAKIVGTGKYTPTDTDKHKYSEKGLVWYNSNKLINGNRTWGYDYATGIKTGFTSPAGHTLVSSAEKGSVSLISVVLKDSELGKWRNSITLFEYGFTYYDTIDLAAEFSEKEIVEDVENAASTVNGSQVTLQLAPKKKVYLTEAIDMAAQVREDIDEYFDVDIQYYEGALVAPIEKGQEVGIITFTYKYDHYYSDYIDSSEDAGTGVKKIQYQALLIAANSVDAVPTVTATPTADPRESIEPTSTGPGEEEKATNKWLLYVGMILLSAAAVMIISSNLMRRYRYQQYYVKNKKEKRKREKPEEKQDDGTIRFDL